MLAIYNTEAANEVYLRLECLRLAHAHASGGVAVADAEQYFQFIRGISGEPKKKPAAKKKSK